MAALCIEQLRGALVMEQEKVAELQKMINDIKRAIKAGAELGQECSKEKHRALNAITRLLEGVE